MSPDQIVADSLETLLDLDPDGFDELTPLSRLEGWDSVNALRVLVYLEHEAGAPLDFERFGEAGTVGDLADVLAAALGAGLPNGAVR
ncbi:MAG TPA: acyl carrier protein [Actinocrinis sp.]|nr:acyl carrier protein [Actinocrinis sp.]